MPFIWAVGLSILGQLLVVFAPPFQQVFQTEAISIWDIISITMLSSSILWLDTARKTLFPKVFNDDYKTSPMVKNVKGGLGKKGKNWLFGKANMRRNTDKGAFRTNKGAKSNSVLAL